MQPQTQRLWRHRDFLKLWAGQSVSDFGSLVGRIALPMMVVLLLHATPMQVSFLRTMEVAPGLVAGLFAGVWADRVRRLPIMLTADLGRALLTAVIPLLFVLGSLTMGYVYAVAFGLSILTVFFDVAYRSYLPSLVEPNDLVEANSKLAATASVAEITGFGIAGVLVQVLTAPITILLDALSFVVSAVSLALIRTRERVAPTGEHERSTWREIQEGFAALAGHPLLRVLAGASGIENLFGNIIGTVIMIFVLEELKLSPALSSGLFALGGVSSLVGATLATPFVRRLGLGRALVAGSLAANLSTFFLALAGGPLWLVFVMLAAQQLLGDGGHTMVAIQTTSLRQAVTPHRLLGRVNATLQVANWTFMLLGTLLGGVLGEVIGVRGALLVAAGGKLLATLWLAASPVARLKEQPEPEAEPA